MSIREKLKQWKRFAAGATAAVLCAGLLAGCTGKNPAGSSDGTAVQEGPQRYSTIFYDAFDTVTQVIAYCDSEEEFTRQMDALHADLLEYHQLYDIYNDYDGVTNIKTINDNAGTAPVQVDDKILGMLELARQMYNTTDGKLNIAMGSVLRIWHDYREAAGQTETAADNKLPSQEELDAAARHCDINNLVMDEEAKTVYLADPEMSLDVGSVGKGYAVEMVAQAAEARGLTSALISVGGNLRAIGVKPDGSQWSGGVENPWNASEFYTSDSSYVAAVNMSDMALVTSGDYQRYYVVDGVRYHHLIDPATLWPAAYFNGVSVLAPDSGVADCLTTGLFCMPLEEGQKIVESLDGVEALPLTAQMGIVRLLRGGETARVGGGQGRTVNVRLIAGAGPGLSEAVREGLFLKELHELLREYTITVPPLRERRSDIEALAARCASRFAQALGKQPKPIAPEAMEALLRYSWPGNVRELEHVIVYGMSMVDETSALLQYKDIKGKLLLVLLPASSSIFRIYPPSLRFLFPVFPSPFRPAAGSPFSAASASAHPESALPQIYFRSLLPTPTHMHPPAAM